jgi:hypothetical protein
MTVLLTLAGPIEQRLRPQFLQEVAAELEAKPAPSTATRRRWRPRFAMDSRSTRRRPEAAIEAAQLRA